MKDLLALLALLCLPLASSAQPTPSLSPEPMMKWADSSRLGRPLSKDPNVIEFGGRYLMYFSLPPFDAKLAPANAPTGWSVGIAESRDLLNWQKVGELWPVQECEKRGMCTPSAVVLEGKVHLFYASYGNGPKDAICHAVSTDGVNFTRDPTNPVLRPTGTWNCGRAIDPEVFVLGDRLMLYFATRDPAQKVQMLGVAAAELKSDFSRANWKQLCDAPILKPELSWEKKCIEAPSLVRRGDELIMFYAGGYNNDPQQVGVAVSRDGLKWDRVAAEPFLRNGQPGEWNASESGHPGAFTARDGQTWLFYQGNNDKGRTWYLSRLPVKWSGGRPGL